MLTGDEARAIEPALSDDIGAAIVLHGQRFINPGAYVAALADAVIARGGKIAHRQRGARASPTPRPASLVTDDSARPRTSTPSSSRPVPGWAGWPASSA